MQLRNPALPRQPDVSRRKRRSNRWRVARGAVTVELAVTLPVLFLLLFAAIEFSHTNVLRNTAENAAYEGARRGIVPGATEADIRNKVNSILQILNVRRARITITPNPITAQTQEVTVSIAIPMDYNGWVAATFMKGKILRRSCTLRRESYSMTSVP